MERTNFFEELKRYFANTSNDQIFKEWKESEDFDNIGPTVEEFLTYADPYYQTLLEDPLSSGKILNCNNLSSEFTSGFFLNFKYNQNAKSCVFN